YTGQMQGGERHGLGKASVVGIAESYDGQWEEGLIHGQGIYKWRQGNSYEGEFAYGLKHGHGSYRWSSGDSYEGQYEED
ncbi:hypothetical protein B484DRAFT_339599, partial [Ochromonadaceae sp. CCMP2298]